MSETRIYKVTTPTGVRLIDAHVKTAAIAHVTKTDIYAEVANGHDIAILIQQGVRVEQATRQASMQLDLLEAA